MRTRRFSWILLLPLLFTLPACNDELLTEKPSNFLAPTNFYRNANDAQIALAGLYAGQMRLQGYVGGDAGVALLWGIHGADEIIIPPWAPAGRLSLFLWNFNPTLDVIETVYQRHYEEINRVNTVLNRVGMMGEDQISDGVRDDVMAQAKALRASFYFNLVRIYNRVPLVLEERENLENLEFTQAEPGEIYAQIIQDLTEAIAVLEPASNVSRISKGAAQALLGKVYLQMGGWPLKETDKYAAAADQFGAVIASNEYALLDDFQQVFDYENELNDEMVWVVQHDGPGVNIDGTQNSNLGTFMGPAGRLEEGAGWGTAWLATKLENTFEREDLRRRVSVAYAPAPRVMEGDSTEGPNQWKPWKWQKPNPNNWGNDTPFDYPYIRYANVLLGFAEADARANGTVTQEAVNAINLVRARARGDADPTKVLIPYTTAMPLEEFVDAVLEERYLELAFEGHRKGDLIRTERAVEVMSNLEKQTAVWPGPPEPAEYKLLWPIPQSVLDLNPALEQNPGW
ncbi:RagB/SusD family nutrient uptake outer membrane protein [Lewinella sp. JB7]|uniref:RagB/SusD family nutrient uptake outer membrane protein n=1 Tax=Lewinella sp. JB7 TaxID=2962887 RepID=UPI0020C95D1A|nr:RagB/SusD family nutrient uptake outer membrane protein [Lewinella sp. JB7]MCP9235844.1 RagB/SusD family nutrient uptake outer membrane protein [Lewinella sp. JB7]